MAQKIQSIEELRRAQAASQAQGSMMTNYYEWANIMQEMDKLGIEKTGSYAGDKEKLEGIKQQAIEVQQVQKQQEIKPSNNENSKVDEKASSDKQPDIKGNTAVANADDILAMLKRGFYGI